MQRGFPLSLVRLVCCPADGGELRPASAAEDGAISDGVLRCARCGQTYRVADGILSLLAASDTLDPESAKEMRIRDARSDALLAGERQEWSTAFADSVEVRPTLDAVDVRPGMTVAELGCGPGRYTLALAARASAVLAVDFSRSGLLVLRRKLDDAAPVGLVQADVTRPYAALRTIDRMLSTLHSNLPGAAARLAALRCSADAMTDTGHAVISMHHHCAIDLLQGVPIDGHYADSGIYRHYMRQAEARHEMHSCFHAVRFIHIAASVPGIRSVSVAKTVAAVPVLRSAFARLFLAIGSLPRRQGPAAEPGPDSANRVTRATPS